MPSIGELYVSLGVKGGDKALGAVTGIRKGIKETASVSLETKAAVVGLMYALERLFSSSSAAGTSLKNFSDTTGISAQTLQKYQYAAQKVGVANDAVEQSFRGLQKSMTDVVLEGKVPDMMQHMADMLKTERPISMDDIMDWQKDPTQLIQALQKYNQMETNAGLRSRTNASFGVSALEPALVGNKFVPSIMDKAPLYSDSEIKQLDKVRVIWAELEQKIAMSIGHFNAMHGEQIAGEISKVVTEVIKMATAFGTLAEKAELFKWLGTIFEGWKLIFEGITAALKFINDTKAPDAKPGEGIGAAGSDYIPEHMQSASPEEKEAYQKNWAQRQKVNAEREDDLISMLANLYGRVVLGTVDAANPRKDGGLDPSKYMGSSKGSLDGLTGGKAGSSKDTIAPTGGKAGSSRGTIDELTGRNAFQAPVPGSSGGTTNIEVKNELNFQHPGTDAGRLGAAVKTATTQTMSQISATKRGN